jgi:glycosyltransferase involved in cell wall biosynthesis
MNIVTCQFNDSYFPIIDGVGMVAHNYAYWLNRKYGKSFLVAPKVNGYMDNEEYDVIRFLSTPVPGMQPYRFGTPRIDYKFIRRLSGIRFDIVHAHCPFVSGRLAKSISVKQKIPLIATFHSKYYEDFMKIFKSDFISEKLVKKIINFYNAADMVWVPNSSTGKTLREYGFIRDYHVISNATDFRIPENDQKQRLKREGLELIKAKRNDFVFLFIGQHRWEKNVRMIIDALHLLNQRGNQFKMIFAGEGYAKKEMMKLVRDYQLQKRVSFMGLISERETLMKLYACADLLVFPSVYDNQPLVVKEAAAFAVPSVLVENSSSAEGIIDGVNGFIVRNQPENLFNTLFELMDNPVLIKNVGMNAREFLYIHWEEIVDSVYECYRDLINAEKSNPVLGYSKN